ncbi:DUF3078 domain-containing protein [Flavobacteriaceae bacterium S356]|uniref:DUF3078 domain-containing protein n=1 Tax=Asprobacillus argus TaxID=3076534 RepID=A0ABU3LGJ3_9FLAO|nr:DUF3078 domain-containing protein [Flavobacteriaceae bacterium S356]
MKKGALILLLFVGLTTVAQEQKQDSISNWKKAGTFTFLFNQSSFSNWIAGGENAVSGTLGVNYDFNYAKDNWTWDNKIITKYGISNISGTGTRKTDDFFEFNSLVGKKKSEFWSYSFFLNIRSQFTAGYDYTTTPKTETSSFFAPGYITFGPGMVYKKSDNFRANFAPLTSKMTFVSNQFAGQYGTDPGKTSRYELGFYTSVYYKTSLMENVTMENIFNAYANYLEDPQNIDINYQLNFVMQINKYLSTNLSFHTIIDDNASSRTQFKEVFGLGVNYIF